MKVLIIGGTGIISSAISRRVVELGWELFLLNRGNRNGELSGKFTEIVCDIRAADEAEIKGKIKSALGGSGKRFDVVADFIAFTADHVEKDLRIFDGLCGQFIFMALPTIKWKGKGLNSPDETG